MEWSFILVEEWKTKDRKVKEINKFLIFDFWILSSDFWLLNFDFEDILSLSVKRALPSESLFYLLLKAIYLEDGWLLPERK